MSKSVSFNKPSRPATPDAWVATKAPAAPSEPTKRFTVDVPDSLHRRVKVHCAQSGITIADMVRDMLQSRFPAQS